MICPSCGYVNFPGDDECARCMFSLAREDVSIAQDKVEYSVLNDRVNHLKLKTSVTIRFDDSLGLALERMVENSVGALMVIDDSEKLIGILTERDYLLKVIGIEENYSRLRVKDFMTAGPVCVSPEDPIASALQKMDDGGYRHLPVVEDGKPVGIVSVRDLMRHIIRISESR